MPTLLDLGVLAGGGSIFQPSSISSDGAVVVGIADDPATGNWRAAKWTVATGLVDMGFPTVAAWGNLYASAVSADGIKVIGRGSLAGSWRPWTWTAATGMVLDPEWVGLTTYAAVFGASADLSVRVGWTTAAQPWVSVAGTVSYPGLMPGSSATYFRAVSDDGTLACGYALVSAVAHAFVFDVATLTYTDIGQFPAYAGADIMASCFDAGHTVYGVMKNVSGFTGLFSYTASGGRVEVVAPDPAAPALFSAPGPVKYASGTLAGSATVMGSTSEAYTWSVATGVVWLSTEFLELTGVSITISALSRSGTVRVGYGYNSTTTLNTGFSITSASIVPAAPTYRYFWDHASGQTTELPI